MANGHVHFLPFIVGQDANPGNGPGNVLGLLPFGFPLHSDPAVRCAATATARMIRMCTIWLCINKWSARSLIDQMRWWAVMSLISNMQNDVGWLAHLPFELLKILKCFSCPCAANLNSAMMWFAVLSQAAQGWATGSSDGSSYRRCWFTNTVSTSGNWQNRFWQNKITKVMQRPISSLSQDDLTPATTRCLIHNFWNSQVNFYRFAWPTGTWRCRRGALQRCSATNSNASRHCLVPRIKKMGATRNQTCFPQNEA